MNNVTRSVESWTGEVRTTTIDYDRLNRPETETDTAGATATSSYDIAGNLESTTSGTSVTTTTSGLGTSAESTSVSEYDAQGHETSSTVTTGPDVETTRTYDLAGRLLSETLDPSGLALTTSYTYDLLGRTLTQTDPDGLVTTKTHDRLGRVARTVVGGTTTDTTYDKLGNALTGTGPYASGEAGRVHKIVYDALDRPVQEITNYLAGSSAPDANLTSRRPTTRQETSSRASIRGGP